MHDGDWSEQYSVITEDLVQKVDEVPKVMVTLSTENADGVAQNKGDEWEIKNTEPCKNNKCGMLSKEIVLFHDNETRLIQLKNTWITPRIVLIWVSVATTYSFIWRCILTVNVTRTMKTSKSAVVIQLFYEGDILKQLQSREERVSWSFLSEP